MAEAAKLPLPNDARTTAFRRVVSLVKQALGKRGGIPLVFRDATDAKQDEEPAKNAVWIRFSPETHAASRDVLTGYGRAHTRSPLVITIETRVPGFLWDNSMNLWGAIEAALFPQDIHARPAFDALNSTYGINDIELLRPAEAVGPDRVGVGQIVVTVFVPT